MKNTKWTKEEEEYLRENLKKYLQLNQRKILIEKKILYIKRLEEWG